jgi:hypothetical protein
MARSCIEDYWMNKILRFRVLAAALSAFFGLMATVHASEAVFPMASRIGLVPPAGLAASHRFPGFEDKKTGASVLIFDLAKQAYSDAAKQLSKESLKKQGIIEETRENFPSPNGKGTLVAGHQDGERKARKWILLAALPEATAFVVVEVPDDAKKEYSDAAIRSMLASVTMRDSVPVEEQLSLLPLSFDDLAGMHPVRVIGTAGAILTSGPKDTLEPTKQPLLIVSIGRGGPESTSGRETFARNLLAGIGNLKDVRVTGSEMLRLGGGLQTHQIFAEGKDAKSGTPVKLVQWIRFGSGAFLRVVGAARPEDWHDAFPRFRAVRDGVHPRT